MPIVEAVGHANGSGFALAVGETNGRSVMESPRMVDASTVAWKFGVEQADSPLYRDAILLALPTLVNETPKVADTPSIFVYLGGLIEEVIRLQQVETATTLYNQLLAELTQLLDAPSSAYAMTLADTMQVADTARAVWALLVMEQLRLTPLLSPAARYGLTVSEALRLSEIASRFFGGAVMETFGVTEAIIPYALFPHALAETIGIADVTAQKLIFRVTASDAIILDDNDLVKLIMSATLADGIEITAAYVTPNNTITAWAVNSRTGAVTEYTNFSFNSFAQAGHKYLGASSTGIYELNGSTDDGTSIIARLRSGFAQFGGAHFSSFKAAYIGVNATGTIIFRLISGEDKTYTYQVTARSMQTTKVNLGKGLRSKYFAFELETVGQDFDLDSVELIPLVAKRRV